MNKFSKQFNDPKVSTKEVMETRKEIEQEEIKKAIKNNNRLRIRRY